MLGLLVVQQVTFVLSQRFGLRAAYGTVNDGAGDFVEDVVQAVNRACHNETLGHLIPFQALKGWVLVRPRRKDRGDSLAAIHPSLKRPSLLQLSVIIDQDLDGAIGVNALRADTRILQIV